MAESRTQIYTADEAEAAEEVEEAEEYFSCALYRGLSICICSLLPSIATTVDLLSTVAAAGLARLSIPIAVGGCYLGAMSRAEGG